MAFSTEPMLGGDKKTPISHYKTQDVINAVTYQGRCLSCSVSDGDMKFTIDKGKNSYFNQHMNASGKV